MINFSNARKARALAAFIAILLIVSSLLSLSSCSLFQRAPEPITEEQYTTLADDLSARVAAGCNEKHYYVSSYLEYWDFPSFEISKLKRIERYYASQYYEDLGYSDVDTVLERAKRTAETYIDKMLLDENDEYRLTLEEINDKELSTDLLILSYIETIGDKYSRYYNSEEYALYLSDLDGEFAGIGVYVQLDYEAHTVTVLETIKDSAAEKAGILPGDMLVAIDGKKIADYEIDVFMDFAKGELGSPVSVTVLRDGKELTYTMNRVPIESTSVDHVVLEDGTAYVYIESFNGNTDEQFIEMMNTLEADSSIKGYIFDLRYNGGGYLDTAVNMLSYFVPKGTNIVSQQTKNNSFWHTSDSNHVITKPMVIICNGYTASAGELFTAAIRDYRDMGLLNAVIVGETTYSKGKVQTIFELSDGSAIILTTGLFNPPSDVNFDGVGVVPDVTVELIPDPEVDNQFEAALDELKKLVNK